MAIYKKGSDLTPLSVRANEQHAHEISNKMTMTPEKRMERENAQGVTGARNAVNLGTTVKEATEYPTTMGGPVSGAELAKASKRKVEAKKTKEREMKRR